MTEIEQYLIDTTEYLKNMGLRTFLIGSTLLQIVRSGEFKIRQMFDKELNLGCLDEELTDEMIKKIKKDKTYSDIGGDSNKKRTIIYFGDIDIKSLQSPFFTPIGFTELVPFFLKDDVRIEYMGSNQCVSWPKYHLKKFETINYKGYIFNVPSNYKNWLKHYFGLDWMKENLKWQWENGAKNLDLWKDLMR